MIPCSRCEVGTVDEFGGCDVCIDRDTPRDDQDPPEANAPDLHAYFRERVAALIAKAEAGRARLPAADRRRTYHRPTRRDR